MTLPLPRWPATTVIRRVHRHRGPIRCALRPPMRHDSVMGTTYVDINSREWSKRYPPFHIAFLQHWIRLLATPLNTGLLWLMITSSPLAPYSASTLEHL
ncbi:MAG: hypothetical protein IPO36_19220 [Anaerolineales bacterium]|nr:hypothetical protein [Anaerolineales bacterium]